MGTCVICCNPYSNEDLSWCKDCKGDICGFCDCGHENWGA